MSGVSGFSNQQTNVNELKSAAKAVGASASKAAEEAVEKVSEAVQQKGKEVEKDASSVSKAGKAPASIGIWDEHPPINKTDMKKLEEALRNFVNNPKSLLEEIRSSKGPDRDEKLLHFGEKLDSMSSKELKSMRDYLGNEMASPKNNDDPLLGSMLKMVNKELDSRENNFNFIHKDPFSDKNFKDIDPGIQKEPTGPSINKDPFSGKNFKYIDHSFSIGILEEFKNIDKGMIVDIPNPKKIEYK